MVTVPIVMGISEGAFRFAVVLVITLVGTGVAFFLIRRPKSDTPATWAMSMAGALGVFGLFLLAYGQLPHEWLTWADSSLGLREDRTLIDTYPIQISGRALRDVVASTIYIVFLGVNIAGWVMWQKRGTAKPKAPATAAPAGTSAFSRPVTKKS
jgi:hypothetical protein